MSKKSNVITVAEVIDNPELTPDEMKKILRDFQALKAQIAKLPKEEVKEARKEMGGISRRVISGKLLELKDKLVPLIKEYREVLKKEFEATITADKPKGNKSISLRVDIFNLAIIRSVSKKDISKKVAEK